MKYPAGRFIRNLLDKNALNFTSSRCDLHTLISTRWFFHALLFSVFLVCFDFGGWGFLGMGGSGVSQESQEDGEVRSVGEELPDDFERSTESADFRAVRESGAAAPPKIRRSERKKSLQSAVSRGLLKLSKPKSPLMRMAEMRKNGLSGRALRQSGLKGLERSEGLARKGRKGFGGRRLASIPEVPAVGEASDEDLTGLGDASRGEALIGVGAVMGEDRKEAMLSGSDAVIHLEWLPEGVNSDLALDLIEAQPLQEMMFVGKQPTATKDSLMEELVQGEKEKENVLKSVLGNGYSLGADEEFPPLDKEGLKNDKEKERKNGGGEERNLEKEQGSFSERRAKKGLMAVRI